MLAKIKYRDGRTYEIADVEEVHYRPDNTDYIAIEGRLEGRRIPLRHILEVGLGPDK